MDQTAQPSDTHLQQVRTTLQSLELAADIKDRLLLQLDRLDRAMKTNTYRVEFDKELEYFDFINHLPFTKSSQDILDLKRASQVLDSHHYGLQIVKDRILEYLSMLILNSKQNIKMKSQVLAFIGLVGSGKTSLAYSIAESLGRKIIRIPLGGLGSVVDLRGQSRVRDDAEPGKVLKAIIDCGVNNPVVLLDEIDRVATESRSDVMGVLVELLDPEQNSAFVDRYVDFPFDLSKVLFVVTANNTANIATAVMDRLEVIEMPSYTDQEKIVIGKQYILPRTLQEAGLAPTIITIDESVWPQIVRPLGYDGGIRSLQRHIQSVVRKVARQVVEGNPGPFIINPQTINQYI